MRTLWKRIQLIFGVVLAGMTILGLASWTFSSPGNRPTAATSGEFVVHEWGTFLSVQGSDGVTLGGMVDSDEVLPAFVEERGLASWQRTHMFSKMETPVTYFYTDKPQTVQVRVDMPHGLLTHWYPMVKGFGPDGFRFFTNLESAKARQLREHPLAALIFYWRELDRQVRIRGTVDKLPVEDDDEYFATRPEAARIGAWASPQSEALPDGDVLDQRVREVTQRFAGGEVPRPEFWGGFIVHPERIEFWQGQAARLHDRFAYVHNGDGWSISRLAP